MNAGAAVELGDVQRPLSLFAQGLLGRPLHLRTVDAAARDGRLRSILTDGQNLHLPVRIADFPTARENLGAYRVAILQQIGYLQAGTFDFDPPPPDAASPGGGASGPSGADPAAALSLWRLPGIRARRPLAPLERFFADAPQPALLRRVFGIVEAMRVTAIVRRNYPGARADIARVHAHALAARPDPAAMRPHIALIEALVQRSLDARFAPREADDPLTAMLALAEPVARPDARAEDSARISVAICALLAGVVSLRPIRRIGRAAHERPDAASTPLAAGRTDDADPFARRGTDAGTADADGADAAGDDDGNDNRDGQSDGAPSGQGGDALPPPAVQVDPNDLDGGGPAVAFHGVLAADLVEQSRAEARARRSLPGIDVDVEASAAPAGAPADASAANDDDADGDDQRDRRSPARAPTARRRFDEDSQRSFLYDEWDYLQQRYRKAWCRVLEERLRGDDADFIADVRRRHAHLSSQVRRQFAAIKPDAFRRVHHTPDGDEFELSSLIDAVVDRRTGHAGDEQIYVRRERAQREVAAAFLVDMSASTDYPIPEPPTGARAGTAARRDGGASGHDDGDEFPYLYGGYPDWADLTPPTPRRRVIDVQKDALALMCDALQTLGDSHAAYGFSGEGRHRVEFKLIKDFGDRLGARTWAAMAAMKPRRSTRMGPAIRHAAAKLLREPARRKVLIIVSDGYPEDDDYGPERGDPEYGIQDTARALREAESAGVTTFCVTVDPAGHDYLRRMCPRDRYLVIDDVDALPGELTKVYRALTA
ncbi:MAG: VWA domain-containing protein [Burkholderiaceae bacterium]